MTHRIPTLAMLGVLAFCACEFGAPIRAGGGTEGVGLSGTLLLPDGSPAAGTKILAFMASDTGSELARMAAKTAAPTALDSATTDARGKFRFIRLDPGTYNLAPVVEIRDDSTLGWFRTGVAYPGGKMQLGKDTLRESGNAALQVLEGNRVLPGAVCFVSGSPYRATTDDQGSCMVRGLPPGNYRISVTYPGYGVKQSPEVAHVESGLNSICGAVDITKAPGGPLSK